VADVAIVSACFGGFDVPPPFQCKQDIDVEWYYFTDARSVQAKPWHVTHVDLRGNEPRLTAKAYKMVAPVETRYVIWIDANMEITSPYFARNALASIHDGVAVFRHPRRDCIYDEARASLGAESQGGKYAGLPLIEQVNAYRAEGYPEHHGLYACGVVAWDMDRARALGEAWLAEQERWSIQDQLSFPVVCWRMGIEPGVFPHPQIERSPRVNAPLSNRWLVIHPHAQAPMPRLDAPSRLFKSRA